MNTPQEILRGLVVLVACSTLAHADLRAGLIAHYPFDGNADDASGNGNHGTVNGATLTTDRFGVPNQAYLFDGTTSFIQVPDTQALRLSGTDYTIAAWVQEFSRDVSWQDVIVAKRSWSCNTCGWVFAIRGSADANREGRQWMHLSGGNEPHAYSDNEIPLAAWHHVAVVYELSGDMTFYLDGQFDGMTPGLPTTDANTVDDMFIGRDSQTAQYHYDGAIDEVRLYDQALTAAEINALYLYGASPGTQYCPGDGVAPHTLCPCANTNNGGMGGCDWGDLAFPEGGVLDATGTDSMAANDTTLVASGISNNFGIFFGANNQVNGGNGNPLNDGLRCAGGGLVRLIPPTMATGNLATTPAPIQTLDSGAAAGVTRRYQYWFRTPAGPCGGQANLTNGYEIAWIL